ncbi:hypothetical protein [Sphingobium tyrosinilyticum]|uniref:Uncharacterized protein n=1 Tax=Sphingobium tyrosinilyticum TaxID=2715436 RepID=A0ABV9F1B6_9SPHN
MLALEGSDHGILSNVLLPGARTRLADHVDLSFRSEISAIDAAMRDMGSAPDRERQAPAWVVPLALFLVSDSCRATQRAFSAVSGRYAEVVTGATAGWVAPQHTDPDGIAAHWQEIVDTADLSYPASVYHEVAHVNAALRRMSETSETISAERG